MDEFKYACMHMVTDLALESGMCVKQFYSKWLFWWLMGMQEPASVMFSIVNLLMHILSADWLCHSMHPMHPMWSFYLTWSYVNTWVWSAMFHTYDAFASSFSLLPFHVLTSPDLKVPFSLPLTSCSCPSQPISQPSRLATLVPMARALSPSSFSK
jgi:hypothetical protein